MDDEGASTRYDAVLEILASTLLRTNTVEAVMRFHPIRPLSENMPVGTLAFLLQFN